MSMSEFEMINHYFRDLLPSRDDTLLGIGDDGAIITVPTDMNLITVMVQWQCDLDYLGSDTGDKVGAGLLLEAIERIKKQHATPAWFTLSLSFSALDKTWLQAFTEGLNKVALAHHLDLIGGDSSRGPETLRIQLSGLQPVNR